MSSGGSIVFVPEKATPMVSRYRWAAEPVRRILLVGAVLVSAMAVFEPITAVAAPAKSPPQLSIAVDDGRLTATKGDKLSYTLTVTNLGTAEIKNLQVTQTVPTTARFVTADSGGAEAKGAVTWKVNLKPTKTETFHTSLTVLSSPDAVLRLATVACAKVSAKSPPLVCAADSNELPAGAAARTGPSAPTRAGVLGTPFIWWYLGGGVALLAAVAIVLAKARSVRLAHS